MKTMNLNFLMMLTIGLGLFFSCGDDDNPSPVNEEETITHVVISLNDGTNTNTFEFEAGDTAGDIITMTEGTTYNVSVAFEDRSNSGDPEDITAEVIEEADEHFILYAWTGGISSFSRPMDDTTRGTEKIGIKTVWTAGNAGNGSMQITLKHEPTSVSDTDNNNGGSAVGGETDVVATFPISVTVN